MLRMQGLAIDGFAAEGAEKIWLKIRRGLSPSRRARLQAQVNPTRPKSVPLGHPSSLQEGGKPPATKKARFLRAVSSTLRSLQASTIALGSRELVTANVEAHA